MTDNGVSVQFFLALQFRAYVELAAGFADDAHRTRFLERMREHGGTEFAHRLRKAIWERMQDTSTAKQEALAL